MTKPTLGVDLALSLLALVSATVGGSASHAIEPPGIGSKWIYRVESGTRQSHWTRMVAATDTIAGRRCLVATSTDDSRDMRRKMAGRADLRVGGGLLYWDLETLDVLADTAFVSIGEQPMEMHRVRRFTDGRHGHPYQIEQTWMHDDTTTTFSAEGQVAETVKRYRTTVVGVEEVLGWSAFKLEYVLVAVDGDPVEPVIERTEWWSPEVRAEVRVVIHRARYDEEELRELVSVDLRHPGGPTGVGDSASSPDEDSSESSSIVD